MPWRELTKRKLLKTRARNLGQTSRPAALEMRKNDSTEWSGCSGEEHPGQEVCVKGPEQEAGQEQAKEAEVSG